MEKIDITPTWSGVLPVYLEILSSSGNVESKKMVHEELKRMAKLADEAVEQLKHVGAI